MPWKVVPDHEGCAFAVVAEDDMAVVACHEDKEGATDQVKALYAAAEAEGEEFAAQELRNRLPGDPGDHDSTGKKLPGAGAGPANADADMTGRTKVRGMKTGAGGGGATVGQRQSKLPKAKYGHLSVSERLEAVEQALCALATVHFEQSEERAQEFKSGSWGGEGRPRLYQHTDDDQTLVPPGSKAIENHVDDTVRRAKRMVGIGRAKQPKNYRGGGGGGGSY